MSIFKEKDIHRAKILVISLILLSFSLAFLQLNKSQTYSKYERVSFESAGATLYANLYYPSDDLEFQDKKPLIIYCHGIGGQRDFDLRIPIEFAKRGFYVASLDYQGHGESEGNINNFNEKRDIPGLALDCSNLLDKLETKPFFTDVNESQIGLIGHSLGGMVVLMNQALDSRFKATVAWAPLVDPSSIGFELEEGFEKYIPKNLLTPENTENLLIIAHEDDSILPYEENALVAHELTDCKLITLSGSGFASSHTLMENSVLKDSISWFELNFFGSETVNGPINITYWINYLLISINLALLLGIILYIVTYSSEFFQLTETPDMGDFNSKKENASSREDKIIDVLKMIIYILIFLNIWQWFLQVFGLFGIFYASIMMLLGYFLVKFYIHYRKEQKEHPILYMKKYVKEYLRTHFKLKIFLYSLSSTVYFLILYILFTFFYPFLFCWPSNLLDFLLGLTVFPVFLSMEILHKKVIYHNLEFIESKKWRLRIMVICTLIIHASLMAFTWTLSFIPAVLITYIIFLIVSVLNTVIYENTRNFFSTILNSFLIIQLFFGAVLSTLFGIQPVFNPLIEILG